MLTFGYINSLIINYSLRGLGMVNVKDFILKHLNFKFYSVLWVPVIIFILMWPFAKFLPVSFSYETGPLESLQLVFLALAFALALNAKVNKTFFNSMAMIVIILFLREINCGRTIFFPIPGEPNGFYSWHDIKYGWLAHPLYGLYMAITAIYFLKHKLFITLWNYIKQVKFPCWHMIFIFVGMIIGILAEGSIKNPILEEMAELLFYTSLTGIIYLYGYHKDFEMKQ